MKKSQHLIAVAGKLSNKYGSLNAEDFRSQIDSALEADIRNASTVQISGVMPFIRMSQQDGATISFDVTRTDGWSAPTITVSNLMVEPANLTPKYQALPQQVQAYLDKYPELYPSQRSGVDIKYDNYVTHLSYQGPSIESEVGVAKR